MGIPIVEDTVRTKSVDSHSCTERREFIGRTMHSKNMEFRVRASAQLKRDCVGRYGRTNRTLFVLGIICFRRSPFLTVACNVI